MIKSVTDEDVKEGGCPKREDGTHCVHWWDGDACCSCGAAPMTAEEKAAQGMEP